MNNNFSPDWEKFWPIRAVVKSSQQFGLEHINTIRAIKKVRALGNSPTTSELEALYQSIYEEWSEMRKSFVGYFYHLAENTGEAMGQKIREVECDDLISFGVDGLYDSVDGYDGRDPRTGKTVKFETYAIHRIRGSILDAIRREDWVPRLVRSRAKKMSAKIEELESELGRIPTDEEMASSLGLSLEEYEKVKTDSFLRSVQSLNSAFCTKDSDNNNEEMSMMDLVCDHSSREPVEKMMQDEFKSKLFGKNFTPLERKIIYSYFYEGRSMKEISRHAGLSESRISQMMTRITERLRDKILRNPEFFGNSFVKLIENYKQKGAKKRHSSKRAMPILSEDIASTTRY